MRPRQSSHAPGSRLLGRVTSVLVGRSACELCAWLRAEGEVGRGEERGALNPSGTYLWRTSRPGDGGEEEWEEEEEEEKKDEEEQEKEEEDEEE